MNEAVEQMTFDVSTAVRKLNTTKYTYKSSRLIEGAYELSLTEQKLISLACKKLQPIYIENRIKPTDLETVLGAMKFSMLKISANEFKREYNIKSNDVYGMLQKASKTLFKKEINYVEENGDIVEKKWTPTCKYSPKEKCVYLTFNPDMVVDLLVFKGKYVALFFDMTQNIKSKYAFRLYEILKNNAYKGEFEITLEQLKFMLVIEGESYQNFANINKKILKPNMKIINEFSDICVEYEPLRSGRFVERLAFKVYHNKEKVFHSDSAFKSRIPDSSKLIDEALEQFNVKVTDLTMEDLFNKAIRITASDKINIDATSYILQKIEQMKLVEEDDKDYIKDYIAFLDWCIKTNFMYKKGSLKKKTKKLKFDNFEGRNQGEDYYNDLDKQFQDRFDEVAVGEE